MDYDNIPTVVFSHPPIGFIGMTEEEARKKYDTDPSHVSKVKAYISKFTNLRYGLVPLGHRDRRVTMYKIITHKEDIDPSHQDIEGSDEKVIGIHMIGYSSDEILQGFAVAFKKGITRADFLNTVSIHPTSAEELILM